MAKYERQFYPGTSVPAKNRKRFIDPKVKLEKLREIAMDDVVKILFAAKPLKSVVKKKSRQGVGRDRSLFLRETKRKEGKV